MHRCILCDYSILGSIFHSGTAEPQGPRKFKETEAGLVCSVCLNSTEGDWDENDLPLEDLLAIDEEP